MLENHLKIWTDGGARGNPGPAGIGVVLESQGKKEKFKKFLGIATNNQAEYQAVIFGLEKAKARGAATIDVFLDAELVVNQLNQKYKIKNKELAPLFVKVWNLSLGFKKVKFIHIYRNDNREADRLVNEAIDSNKKTVGRF